MKILNSVIFKNSIRRDERIGKTDNEKLFSVISFIVVFNFFALVMIVISKYVTYHLKEIDQTYAFVNMLVFMNFIILFTKSVFESLNILYFSKDLNVLLRLPIKSISILHSKLKNMVISEYPMEIIMLAIPMVVYGVQSKVRNIILSLYDRNIADYTSDSYHDYIIYYLCDNAFYKSN